MNWEKIKRPRRLILIRHAFSERNKAKKGCTYFADEYARRCVKGIPDQDIPLASEGHIQSNSTGVWMREKFGVPDIFYDSGYLRTKQTRAGILEAFSGDEIATIKLRSSPFICERHAGYTYDMTVGEAEIAYPWLKEYWKVHGGFIAKPPGGESLMDVSIRVRSFLDHMFNLRSGQDVWAVTHGGTLRVFRFLLEHWDFDQAVSWLEGQSPKNCGVTVYEYCPEAGRLVLREYNTVCPNWLDPKEIRAK